MPHDQVRFHLVDGIHRHADDDQQRGAAEIEVHAQSVRHPGRQAIEERSQQPQMVQVNAADHKLRDQRDDDQV